MRAAEEYESFNEDEMDSDLSNAGSLHGGVHRNLITASVTSISPDSGVCAGGDLVTVYGTSFESPLDSLSDAASVHLSEEDSLLVSSVQCLFGDVSVLGWVVNSTAVQCESPPHLTPGDVAVTISLSGVLLTSSTAIFTYTAAAVISDVAPLRGSTLGGSRVCISGSGYSTGDVAMCRFHMSVNRNMNKHEDTKMEIRRRRGSLLSAVHPADAETETVSMTSRAVYVSESELECFTRPSTPGMCALSVSVDTMAITMTHALFFETHFLYVTPPKVLSFFPSVFPLGRSTHVIVLGVGFEIPNEMEVEVGGDGGHARCSFGSTVVDAIVVSDSEMMCTCPASLVAYSGDFSVLIGGIASVGGALPSFRYQLSSSLTSISPERGVCAGGDLITVYGTSFESSLHSLSDADSLDSMHVSESMSVSVSSVQCVFGDVSVLGWVVNSTAIQCESPSYPSDRTGSVSVSISISIGGYIVLSDVNYTYITPPLISEVTPSHALTTGGANITVLGSGFFTDDIKCHFGSTVVKGYIISNSEVQCVAPSQPIGFVDFTVTFGGLAGIPLTIPDNSVIPKGRESPNFLGLKSSAVMTFEFIKSPTVLSIVPTRAWVDRSTQINILGYGFTTVQYSMIKCNFHDIAVVASALSDEHLVCDSPVSDPRIVSLSVGYTNEIPFITQEFVFSVAPTVTSIYPLRASVDGGGLLNIYGTGFMSGGRVSCRFGTTLPSDVSIVSDGNIQCRFPRSEKGTVLFILFEEHSGLIFSSAFEFLSQPIILTAYFADLFLLYVRTYVPIGSSALFASGDNPSSTDITDWYCGVGDVWMPAVIQEHGMLVCGISGIILHPNSTVSIRDESGDFLSNSLLMQSRIVRTLEDSTCGVCTADAVSVYRANTAVRCHLECLKELSSIPQITPHSALQIFNGVKYSTPLKILPLSTYENPYGTTLDLVDSDEFESWSDEDIPISINSKCIINGRISCISPMSLIDIMRTNRLLGETSQNKSHILSGPRTTFQNNLVEDSLTSKNSNFQRNPELNSITPTILVQKNSTWLAVTGKYFTNNTKCRLNNRTYAMTYYISSTFLQCNVPQMALLKTWRVSLSLENIIQNIPKNILQNIPEENKDHSLHKSSDSIMLVYSNLTSRIHSNSLRDEFRNPDLKSPTSYPYFSTIYTRKHSAVNMAKQGKKGGDIREIGKNGDQGDYISGKENREEFKVEKEKGNGKNIYREGDPYYSVVTDQAAYTDSSPLSYMNNQDQNILIESTLEDGSYPKEISSDSMPVNNSFLNRQRNTSYYHSRYSPPKENNFQITPHNVTILPNVTDVLIKARKVLFMYPVNIIANSTENVLSFAGTESYVLGNVL